MPDHDNNDIARPMKYPAVHGFDEVLPSLAAFDAIIDVRSEAEFALDHIPGAIHVNDENVGAFIATADKTRTHIIYCYHGNNSQGGAAYFEENGFEDVYSMAGGFSEW